LRPALTALARVLLVLLVLPPPAAGETLQGTIYAATSRRALSLYVFSMDRPPDGGTWRSSYRTAGGDLVAEDELTLVDGQLQRYRYSRPNIGETASVERVGDEIHFVQEIDGKRRERRDKFDSTVTVGPTVIRYIQQHWSTLTNGREVRTRHCVLDHLRCFTFRLVLDRTRPAGPGLTVIRMTASHPAVRAFSSPAYFVLTSDGRTLESMMGRVLPRVADGEEGRPLEAELVIEIRSDTAADKSRRPAISEETGQTGG
jgi:hypothetical protein